MSKGNLSGHAHLKMFRWLFFLSYSKKVNFFEALLVMVQNYVTCYLGSCDDIIAYCKYNYIDYSNWGHFDRLDCRKIIIHFEKVNHQL